MALDQDKLMDFIHRFVGDLGATMTDGNVVVGHQTGLYTGLADGPTTGDELAARTGTDPRYVTEWLRGQAAAGYVTYDDATRRYSLTPEQAYVLADPDGAVNAPADQEALRALLAADPAGRPPVVLVSGEAGVGKTALIESVLAGPAAGLPVLRGRAGEWRAAAYDVLAQVLRQRRSGGPAPAAGPDGVARDPALASAGGPDGVARDPAPAPAGGPDKAARHLAPVLPELGPPAGPVNRSLLAAAIRTALGGGPAAVLLDDLQWADDDTLDLLPALADALRGRPVPLVGCYRSDELPRGHRLRAMRAELRRRGLLAEIPLAPLSRADVCAMLGDSVSSAVAAAIADRADGLPYSGSCMGCVASPAAPARCCWRPARSPPGSSWWRSS